MSEPINISGKCLCGEVSFAGTAARPDIHACHCSMCQRWGGGAFLSLDCQEVSFSEPQKVAIYASSEWAERGFCATCGTHLFYRLKQGDHYAIPAGVMAPVPGINMHEQIFIDEKPDWYDFANDTPKLTGAETFAKYAPPET